ncbi:efflux RND transporter permease subunit, partial [[Eubacterium] cellulosolvens]
MFRWVGRAITRGAPGIIIIILLISMVFALSIPEIKFKTNLNRFLPDNELVHANERVNDYFGDDQVVHLIYLEEDNSAHDLLTPDALRDQYTIYETIKVKKHVESILSIVSILDEVYRLVDPVNYTELDELPDSDIENIKWLFFGILNGSINIDYINNLLSITPELTLDELRQMADIFFDKDFNYYSSNPTTKSTIMVVLINGSLSRTQINDLTKDIQTSVSTDYYTQLTVSHTGSYVISADLDEVSSENFSTMGIVIIVLISVILLLTFRKLSYVLIPLITLALAIIWTFGTMIILNIEFSVIMVVIIPLIIGLGVDYSVYISKRYQEELRSGKSISEAMESAIGSVGTAMFLAVVTTIIAFMSNITSNIIPIREFGLVCGLGIFYAFFLTLTFHTSLRWLIDIKSAHKPTLKKENELYLIKLGTSTASRSVLYYPVLVMIIVVLLTIGAILFGANVRTEFNDKDFLPNDWESLQTQTKIEESFNGSSFSQAYILLELADGIGAAPNPLVTVETLRSIQAIQDNISDDQYIVRVDGQPRIDSILIHVQNALKSNSTLASIVDRDSDLFPDTDFDVQTVFDYLYETSPNQNLKGDSNGDGAIAEASLMRSDIADVLYRNDAGEYTATVIRVYVSTQNSDEVRKMYDELKDDVRWLEITGVNKIVTGNMILTITTMDSLQDSQIKSTAISMVFALIILIIIYRNPILGLIAMTPVLISSIWILGTMYIFGISINVFTVSITALTIGLGIDYAIHIIERFREERKKLDTRQAIHKTIHNTGTALFISALTTVCGFIVLIISKIPPIQHFGIITGMTIIYSSILAVVVIPIFLMRWSKNSK